MDIEGQLKAALQELVDAIGKRWDGETEKKRANAISPRMEEAIENAKRALDAARGKQ